LFHSVIGWLFLKRSKSIFKLAYSIDNQDFDYAYLLGLHHHHQLAS
jgi:hypothetical protein